MMKWMCVLSCCVAFCRSAICPVAMAEDSPSAEPKPRLIVLTDIGGDPDDQQSMIRLMLYSNEFEIEGLIATASGVPGEIKEPITRPELIREIVDAYGKVRSNLTKHAEGYPPAEDLLARIKTGNRHRGRDAIGERHETEGSRWIMQVVDRDDPRPVNISIWGGQTDYAQALWRVRNDRGAEGLKRFLAKIRVYDIADQDGIVEWMWQEFPDPNYILGMAPKGRDKREGVFRGLYLGGDESLASREWMETNIRQNHGPLGALYPPHTWTEPNPHSAIKEGDTPSWFFFLPTGLSDPDHPEWGGWGGRFQRPSNGVWRDAKDTIGEETTARACVWRWRPAFQADFAARLDWCTTPDRAKANHNPIATLNGDETRKIIRLEAKPGQTVELFATGSQDPDGNKLEARWFLYREAGTASSEVTLSTTKGLSTSFQAPSADKPQAVHVILEVQDNGSPRLSTFRRAVIQIAAEKSPSANEN
jgi:hypothetical protein